MPQTHSGWQMLEYTHTRRHDLTVYCSRFYGRPISLLLPFVLRIISLHGMGGFELSHFLFIPCTSPIFTIPFHLYSVAFVSLCFSIVQMFGGQSAVTAVQTGGPKPPRYFLSLFTFLSQCPPSLLSRSILPGCLARRTVLDLFFLSALCIWMVLCATLGLRPDVRASGCTCFVSLRGNVITLQFVNLKLTWLHLTKSATLKFLPS